MPVPTKNVLPKGVNAVSGVGYVWRQCQRYILLKSPSPPPQRCSFLLFAHRRTTTQPQLSHTINITFTTNNKNLTELVLSPPERLPMCGQTPASRPNPAASVSVSGPFSSWRTRRWLFMWRTDDGVAATGAMTWMPVEGESVLSFCFFLFVSVSYITVACSPPTCHPQYNHPTLR